MISPGCSVTSSDLAGLSTSLQRDGLQRSSPDAGSTIWNMYRLVAGLASEAPFFHPPVRKHAGKGRCACQRNRAGASNLSKHRYKSLGSTWHIDHVVPSGAKVSQGVA